MSTFRNFGQREKSYSDAATISEKLGFIIVFSAQLSSIFIFILRFSSEVETYAPPN